MPLEKRSLSVAGHRTSVALEAEFWAALDEAAAGERRSLAGLVAEIDRSREPDQGLASALRVWILRRAQAS